MSSQCSTSTSSSAHFFQEFSDATNDEDDIYKTEFDSVEIGNNYCSVESNLKRFNDKLRSSHDSSYYSEDNLSVNNCEYFVDLLHQMDNESGVDKDILKTNPEQNSWQVCNTETDDIYLDILV